MRILSALAGAMLGAALPQPSLGAGLPERTACFERVYDSRHLARHPAQQVRRIQATYTVDGQDVQVHLDVWLRRDRQHHSIYADCTPDGDGRLCTTGFDHGFWRVEAGPRGALRVQNFELWINPDAADSQERLPEGRRLRAVHGDREWILPRATCRRPGAS